MSATLTGILIALSAGLFFVSTQAFTQEPAKVSAELGLPVQPLLKAPKAAATEVDLQVAFYSASTDGIEARALMGAHSSDEALNEKWYPSKYGADDTIGAANNLSPDIVREVTKLVTKGKVYSLAIDTGPESPKFPSTDFKVRVLSRPHLGEEPEAINKGTASIDTHVVDPSVGTNIDGLAHVGINFRHYNGYHADEIYRADGLRKLDLHGVPPIVTRGVVLDMAGYFGVDIVEAGTAFNKKDIKGAAALQGVEIRKGDVVLLHTGFLNLVPSNNEKFLVSWPGLGTEGAQYLASLGIVAVGANTMAGEVHPAEVKGTRAPVHQILVAKNGVYVMENVDSRELVADGVSEFLFVLGVPRLVGAVNAIIHPIAIR